MSIFYCYLDHVPELIVNPKAPAPWPKILQPGRVGFEIREIELETHDLERRRVVPARRDLSVFARLVGEGRDKRHALESTLCLPDFSPSYYAFSNLNVEQCRNKTEAIAFFGDVVLLGCTLTLRPLEPDFRFGSDLGVSEKVWGQLQGVLIH